MNQNEIMEYYGNTLKNKDDLATSACCPVELISSELIKNAIKDIDKEILNKYYGCGSPIPPLLDGLTVLDLGCGSGRDSYVVSKLVGENGKSIGIDMTENQIKVAQKHIKSQTKKFGYEKANVEFIKGYIEDLEKAGIKDNSIDLVISNCVINLSPDKEKVFSEIYRILKPGGELYFSDVFSDRRIPDNISTNTLLVDECLGGALYREDFRRLMQKSGFPDFRKVSEKKIDIGNKDIEEMTGNISFFSSTIRAFKIESLEDICEDYGQIATYKGTIPEHPNYFDLDDHHRFITGKPMLVCGNSTSMLQETRFSPHFDILGDRSTHFGPFDCVDEAYKESGSGCCGGSCGC